MTPLHPRLESAPRSPLTARPGPGHRLAAAPRLTEGNVPGVFGLAVRLHQAGHLDEAETVYEHVLNTDPRHADALHLLGVLHHQRGDHDLAMECLHRAATLDAPTADFFCHLGEVYLSLQRLDEAVESFEQALALEPNDTDSLCNLGHAYIQAARFRDAELCYRRALALTPDDVEAYTCLGVALVNQGRSADAEAAYRAAIALDPKNAEPRHMLAALRGDAVDTAPPAYVIGLFDRYADDFDRHLVESLQYRVPALIRTAIDALTDPHGPDWRVIDLGCGTGLCGAAICDRAAHLTGVDLAPRMLEHARRRGIYDVLLHGDVMTALAPVHGPADVVTAGDVFIYVGALDRVFGGVANVLAPDGLLAFSIEETADLDHDRGFALTSSGRFAHSPDYIRRTAAAHGLELVHETAMTVRTEGDRPCPGRLYVARRQACAA